MGIIDNIKYSAKLYELENGRFNYYVYVRTRTGERWSQDLSVGGGVADTEASAIEEAQKKATADRQTRAKEGAMQKTVALK